MTYLGRHCRQAEQRAASHTTVAGLGLSARNFRSRFAHRVGSGCRRASLPATYSTVFLNAASSSISRAMTGSAKSIHASASSQAADVAASYLACRIRKTADMRRRADVKALRSSMRRRSFLGLPSDKWNMIPARITHSALGFGGSTAPGSGCMDTLPPRDHAEREYERHDAKRCNTYRANNVRLLTFGRRSIPHVPAFRAAPVAERPPLSSDQCRLGSGGQPSFGWSQ